MCVGCYKLLTACCKLVDNLGQAVRTQLVDGLLADWLQDVRFCLYMCTTRVKTSQLVNKIQC